MIWQGPSTCWCQICPAIFELGNCVMNVKIMAWYSDYEDITVHFFCTSCTVPPTNVRYRALRSGDTLCTLSFSISTYKFLYHNWLISYDLSFIASYHFPSTISKTRTFYLTFLTYATCALSDTTSACVNDNTLSALNLALSYLPLINLYQGNSFYIFLNPKWVIPDATTLPSSMAPFPSIPSFHNTCLQSKSFPYSL